MKSLTVGTETRRVVTLGGDKFLLSVLAKDEVQKAARLDSIKQSVPDFYQSGGSMPGSLTYARQMKDGKTYFGYYRLFEIPPLVICWEDGTVMGSGGEYSLPWQPCLLPVTRDGKYLDSEFWRDNPPGSISFGGCLQVDDEYYGFFSVEKLPEITDISGSFELVDTPEDAGELQELMWISTGTSLVSVQPIVNIPLHLLFAHGCLPVPHSNGISKTSCG